VVNAQVRAGDLQSEVGKLAGGMYTSGSAVLDGQQGRQLLDETFIIALCVQGDYSGLWPCAPWATTDTELSQ
jgi:hypothetical protein